MSKEANKAFELICSINGLDKTNPIRLESGQVVYRNSKTNLAWKYFLKGWVSYSKYNKG